MNLITFGFSEKGTPIFLNQEPFQQVGTMYLMKAGENSIIGITLDDKLFKTPKVGRPSKVKAEKAETIKPKKRGRKPRAKSAATEIQKGGRKSGKPKVSERGKDKKGKIEEAVTT